jgi:uncharacterized protein (TIGR03643 family)
MYIDQAEGLEEQPIVSRKRHPVLPSSRPALRALDAGAIHEVIQMALSDHVTFAQIQAVHGLPPDAVKALMRQTLKPGSYRAWRKRVREFSDRRAVYK